jgi:hypothetical protein
MKRLLIVGLLLSGCNVNYPGISDEEFQKILDSCEVPMISLEKLSDVQLIEYGRHQQFCKAKMQTDEQDTYQELVVPKTNVIIHAVDWTYGAGAY